MKSSSTPGVGMFDKILEFERALAEYTSAPYAIMTDCCTHAIELCLRYERPNYLAFTAFTYLSVPMIMHKLGIEYRLIPEDWTGEYQFLGSRIWDSARRLERDMYRPGMMQCLSFGHGKPLQIGRGGAILLDDVDAYKIMLAQRYDGRNLDVSPWQDQKVFRVGYHYRPTIEEAAQGLELLDKVDEPPKYVSYPDLREIQIIA
jgi:dTDP-4-amino-4,6-dideoxygalactose transaminase